MRGKVCLRQKHMKEYFDIRCGARTPSFRKGVKVRVLKPVDVLKGPQKFSAPVMVKKQVGPSTYILDDGKTWHAFHLTSVPTELPENSAQAETEVGGTVKPGNVQQTRRRPVRADNPPAWLKGYKT